MLFGSVLRKFREMQLGYKPLVRIHIHRSALLHNFNVFSDLYKTKYVVPVLKSNAYGHGLILVAKIFDNQGAPFFVVDSYFEALMLKRGGIKTPILVIGYSFPQNVFGNKKKDIIFTFTTMYQIECVASQLKNEQHFHLKIDTGMHRQGIRLEDVERAVALIKSNKNIVIDGVCSHFADADEKNSEQTKEQCVSWNKIISMFKKDFPKIKYFHIEATAGTQYDDICESNTIRIGIGMYGIDSVPVRRLNLLPTLEMESVVVGIKILKKNECVGYNGTYCAEKDIRIGIVPVGYYEGIDRRLSNKGFVKIRGIECPILGRVSMNMISVDVSGIPDIKEEEPVQVISNNKNDKNSINFIAGACGAIPYEILVGIPERLRREVID